jgi:hypothetical protein
MAGWKPALREIGINAQEGWASGVNDLRRMERQPDSTVSGELQSWPSA